MISLVVNDGKAYVWNGDDWLKLREHHRIVGDLIGCLSHLPRQETFPGLPMVLLPEQATLLVEKQLARLVHYPSLSDVPVSNIKENFNKYREQMKEEQIKCFKEERKRQIVNVIDRIVEGKRRKLMGLCTKKKQQRKAKMKEQGQEIADNEQEADTLNREALLEEEFAKIPDVPENNILIQTFTNCPWLRPEDAVPAEWKFPETQKQKLRYCVFKDLWEKGYHLTGGHKFGADFLVYPGDPVKFHAHLLVVCMDREAVIPAKEIVMLGRLGSSVRKTVVLATLSASQEAVMYQSLQWSAIAS